MACAFACVVAGLCSRWHMQSPTGMSAIGSYALLCVLLRALLWVLLRVLYSLGLLWVRGYFTVLRRCVLFVRR